MESDVRPLSYDTLIHMYASRLCTFSKGFGFCIGLFFVFVPFY